MCSRGRAAEDRSWEAGVGFADTDGNDELQLITEWRLKMRWVSAARSLARANVSPNNATFPVEFIHGLPHHELIDGVGRQWPHALTVPLHRKEIGASVIVRCAHLFDRRCRNLSDFRPEGTTARPSCGRCSPISAPAFRCRRG